MQIKRFFSNMWIYNLSASEILVQVCEWCLDQSNIIVHPVSGFSLEGTALQAATVFGHCCKCCKIFGD